MKKLSETGTSFTLNVEEEYGEGRARLRLPQELAPLRTLMSARGSRAYRGLLAYPHE
jgi:hypothetical protein